MIGFYNYTVILTYIGTISGFMGISFVMNANSNLTAALICLLFSGLCDMFDGKIASTKKDRTKQEKSFGIQIDSLSDLVCFGMLPASIIVHCSSGSVLSITISAAYLLCTLIRLAWFNVDEEERQGREDCVRKVYLGLPVTTSALMLPFAIGLGQFCNLDPASYMPWVLLAIAAGFITPFQLKKPGLLGKIIMVLLGVALLAMILFLRRTA